MSNHLEDAVAKTAAIVAGAHAKIKALEGQAADWTQTVATATADRERLALAALTGDAGAAATVKKAVTQQQEGEQHLETISFALPAARQELAAAERAAAAARRELAMHLAQGMMRSRIAAGARMDAGFAAIAEAYLEYESLGKQLQSFPDLDLAQGGMARWEDTTGLKRISAALPAFFKALPAWTLSHPAKFVPLAVSEAGFWSLPPPEKAKAA
jgi:hypothetical protein